MKRIIVLLLMATVSATAFAGDDKPISFEKLPDKAQEFIKAHFPDHKVSLVTLDDELFDKTYEVFFTDGSKVEFNHKGEWYEIDCEHSRVPESIIPQAIFAHVDANHPGLHVTEIERDKHNYDVKLSNGLNMKYDLDYNFIRYDD